MLLAHPAVLECAVVGSPDGDGLTQVHAYVTLRTGATQEGLAGSLQAFAKARLAAYKAPRWVTVLAELPKTATGKSKGSSSVEVNRERAGFH